MREALRRIQSIARVTAAELLRQPLAWVILVLAAGWLGSSLLWSQLSLAEQASFWKDFGFGGLLLASVLLALAMGAPLIAADRGRRTFDLTFSRPVRRVEYLIGKWFALALILAQAVVALALMWSVILQFHGAACPCRQLWGAACVAWAYGLVVAGLVLALASVSASQVFILVTTALLLFCAQLEPLAREMVMHRGDLPLWQSGYFSLAAVILPDVSLFNCPLTGAAALRAIGYAFFYSALTLIFGAACLRARDSSD